MHKVTKYPYEQFQNQQQQTGQQQFSQNPSFCTYRGTYHFLNFIFISLIFNPDGKYAIDKNKNINRDNEKMFRNRTYLFGRILVVEDDVEISIIVLRKR